MTIKCDKDGTRVSGSTIDTIQDFINIINAVHVVLVDDLGEDNAAEIMKQCGRLAFAGEDKDAEAAAFQEITALLLKNGRM